MIELREGHQQQIKTILALLDHSSIKYSDYYFHHGSDMERYDFDKMVNEPTGNIIIFHHDHFDDENNQLVYNTVRDNFKKLSNKKIIVVTSLLNLNFDLDHVKTIHWGGEILFQEPQYKQMPPHRTKNFNSATHWISLIRSSRAHRILAAIYMLGKDLGSHGNIRCSSYLHTLRECPTWTAILRLINYTEGNDFCTKNNAVMTRGFDMLKNQQYVDTQEDAGSKFHKDRSLQFVHLDSIGNFQRHLKQYYENSVVEIVNETVFFQSTCLVTEKFLNSVYGFNLPIVLGSAGYIAHLRDIGFDLFDDVIDHSYDLVQDPLSRIQTAVDRNQRLLTDPDFARQCWKDCSDRLEKNYKFAQSQMHDLYRVRCLSEFNAVFPRHFNPTPNQ